MPRKLSPETLSPTESVTYALLFFENELAKYGRLSGATKQSTTSEAGELYHVVNGLRLARERLGQPHEQIGVSY